MLPRLSYMLLVTTGIARIFTTFLERVKTAVSRLVGFWPARGTPLPDTRLRTHQNSNERSENGWPIVDRPISNLGGTAPVDTCLPTIDWYFPDGELSKTEVLE